MSGADYLTVIVLVVIGVLAVCAMWSRDVRSDRLTYDASSGATDGADADGDSMTGDDPQC